MLTTVTVVALSYWAPPEYSATAVGLAFLGVTYWLTLRDGSSATARHFGLSLGGVLEPEPIDARRVCFAALSALGWAALLSLLIFPLFWAGYLAWWQPRGPYVPRWPVSPWDDVLGQVLVIALPEEAFYRGYLQTAFDDVWRPRFRLLGAAIGPGLIVSSILFAIGHVLTDLHPSRLAVFFPSLVFGWLRSRTGGIGAPLVFHASCNLFAAHLARSYGLVP